MCDAALYLYQQETPSMAKRLFRENIKVALTSIRGQLLRTILTVLIIAFGITALVGILTATDAIKQSLEGNFSILGANTITIQNRGGAITIGRGGQTPKKFPPILYDQAMAFKQQFDYPGGIVSISFNAAGAVELKSGSNKTDPNVAIVGADAAYLKTAGYEVRAGRNFNPAEILLGVGVAIIGDDVAKKLFPNIGYDKILGKELSARGMRYKVIGILASKGSSAALSGDNQIFIPITKARSSYAGSNRSYAINIMAPQATDVAPISGAATGLLRNLRKLHPRDDDNFTVTKSESLSASLFENLRYVTMAAAGIGFITLLGAAIALMNIMLVSVTERTREIGTRKAMGAKRNSILWQFLTEAIVICQLGGLLGTVVGILMGNIVSLLLGSPFVIPWFWIVMAGVICFFVGVISGLYPAIKAAKLDPIEALRYE